MFPSDSLLSWSWFRQAYTLHLYLSVTGRVSPVPNHTFHTYRFPYTEGFFRVAFQFLYTFHGLHPYVQGSTSLCSPFGDLFNDTAEFTLCYGLHDCSHLFQGYFIHSLSTLYYYNAPSLTTRLTGDYRDRTYTGKCSPALLDTRNKNRASLYTWASDLYTTCWICWLKTFPHSLSQKTNVLYREKKFRNHTGFP